MGLLLILIFPCVGLAWLSFQGQRPDDLGVVNNQLRPCPDKPNCVCTCATDTEHGIAPLEWNGKADVALQRIRQILTGMPRTQIVTEEGNYLHVEFTSLIFRFVDDVEFLVDPDAGLVHFRSASRVGHSDLGANRARMEKIRSEFTHQSP